VSSAALTRRPLVLLFPFVGALLVLAVLGPNLRGAAAAALVAAGAGVLAVRERRAVPAGPRPLQIIDRMDLGARQCLVLLETGGRRYLVTTGASVTLLPPEEQR
jgi:hypothetical protein